MVSITTTDTAAERDSVTGLQTRRAFSRQVNQAICDSDPYAIALITLHDFETTVQNAGLDATDDLLISVGRALLDHTSAATTVARTGDHQFGILTVGLADENLTRWSSPVITSIKLAISAWTSNQADFVLDPVSPPVIRVGAALGTDHGIWDQAGLALRVASDDSTGEQIVLYEPSEPRIARLENRMERDNLVREALSERRAIVANQRIELVGRTEQSWTWLRLSAAIPARGSSFDLIPTLDASPRLGRQLEQFVLKAAAEMVSAEEGSVRVTVPVSRELLASRSFNEQLFPILERSRIPLSRLVFEIEEAALEQSPKRGTELIKKLNHIGSAVAVRNCSGQWETWELCTELPINFISPSVELYNRFSEVKRSAVRLLTSMAATCDESDVNLIAPFSSRLVPASTLTEVGFTYIEQAPTVGLSRRTERPTDIGFSRS